MKLLVSVFICLGLFVCESNAQEIGEKSWGGGDIVAPAKYPAVIQIFMGKERRCSASIVGPNVILTAAHCSNSRGEVFENGYFYIGDTKYTFKFYTHQTVMEKSVDVAYGIIDQNITNITPLTIGFDSDFSESMVSIGYGCTAKYPTESFVKNTGIGNDSRFLSAIDDAHPVFACGGDSGGPTLAHNKNIKRRITGVHFFSDAVTTRRTTGDMRTDTNEFIIFTQHFAEQNNAAICGYNLDCD